MNALLAPFYERLTNLCYPLAPQQRLDPARAATSLTEAVGTRVGNVLLVPCGKTATPPPWLDDPTYLSARVGALLGERFHSLLEHRFSDAGEHRVHLIEHRPAYDARSWLYHYCRDFGSRLDWSLRDSVASPFRDVLYEQHREWYIVNYNMPMVAFSPLVYPLYYFLGFTILEDERSALSLEPLVRLLQECIPLGPRREDGAWLVLCE